MSIASFKKFRVTHVERVNNGNFGPAGQVIVTTVLIFFISQILAATIAYSILSAARAYTSFEHSIAAQFLFVLLAEATAVGATLIVIKQNKLPFSAIGLGRKPVWKDLSRAFIGFLVFYALLIIAGLIINAFAPSISNEKQDIGFNAIQTTTDNLLAFIALVFLPPIGEEILTRGYLYSGLRASLRFWPALLITSVIFASAHLFEGTKGLLWSGALDTFLLSVVLVFLREKTGALYAGILVHMANNLIAFSLAFH